MRSRPVRLTLAALATIVACAVGLFLFRSEPQLNARRTAVRAFDGRAREAVAALSDLRSGQQAYVAAGQGVAFWMPKVAETLAGVTESVNLLRQSAQSTAARTALDEAASSLTEFASVDKRARDYLKAGQPLMAADVVFTEGSETAATVARQVEGARTAEHEALDAWEAGFRRTQAAALGAAAALMVLIVVLLAPAGPRTVDAPVATIQPPVAVPPPVDAPAVEPVRAGAPVLKAAADLCSDFGRVRALADIDALLVRAAELLDASGIVVWWGDAAGGDLRPALVHGYAPQVVARMPHVPRSADNAAAAAYRTGTLQVVVSRAGSRAGSAGGGAVVAPIVSSGGTIGAFSAEIRGGGEASESVQALATLIAAQLSTLLAEPSLELPDKTLTA